MLMARFPKIIKRAGGFKIGMREICRQRHL
jgi:hypothetical protein